MTSHMKLHKYTYTRAKIGTIEQGSWFLKTVFTIRQVLFFWNNQSAPQKLERLIVTQVNHKLLFAALSTLMINLFFQENSEPT